MGEPGSAVTVTTVTLTSVTFASLLQDTPAGVYVGAFTGAVVYVLSSQDLGRFAQVGYFVASFLLGVISADFTTAILNELIGKYLPDEITINNSIGATVAAAVGVCVLIAFRKINIQTIANRIFGGGGDGNVK